MKRLVLLLVLLFPFASARAQSSSRTANTVILDENGIRNLRLQTVTVEPGKFEETVFALGRIEVRPDRVAVVSSRISGRVTALPVQPGAALAAGAPLLSIESRQPGSPPPTVVLSAPLTGQITRLDVRLGDPVEPERVLAEITDTSEVLAVARLPEPIAGKLRPGALARIRVAAFPEQEFTGTLDRFASFADETSGTLDALFVLQNTDGRIRPGMRAEFSVVLSTRDDVMTVPRLALQGDTTDRFVYVKDFDLKNAFVKTPVVIGQTSDRVVEIVSGLLPTDEVVTQGAYSLGFVGAGTVSLKAALDAAHGHEHAEDGSELTPAQRAALADAARNTPDQTSPQASRYWMGVSALLFALLILASWKWHTASRALAALRKGT